jgi:hypothetical protein
MDLYTLLFSLTNIYERKNEISSRNNFLLNSVLSPRIKTNKVSISDPKCKELPHYDNHSVIGAKTFFFFFF